MGITMYFTIKNNGKVLNGKGNPKKFLEHNHGIELLSINNPCPTSGFIPKHIEECVSLAMEFKVPVWFEANGLKYEITPI